MSLMLRNAQPTVSPLIVGYFIVRMCKLCQSLS
nr:MAG TPA: hypothetical protein [Caudoviricetes sp.]